MKPQTVSSKTVLLRGLRKGLHGYFWLLKILMPISFFMMLFVYSGWIRRLDFVLDPIMGLFQLPSIAAVPLLIGIFTGIYSGIAAMAPLSLNPAQVTLMAVFMLIAHNLVQESAVQDRSGPFCRHWRPSLVGLGTKDIGRHSSRAGRKVAPQIPLAGLAEEARFKKELNPEPCKLCWNAVRP